MNHASEDEDEDNFVGTTQSKLEPGHSRSEREEQLRKMMDEGKPDHMDFKCS